MKSFVLEGALCTKTGLIQSSFCSTANIRHTPSILAMEDENDVSKGTRRWRSQVSTVVLRRLLAVAVSCLATSSSAEHKASEIFCGSVREYLPDPVIPWGPGTVNTGSGFVRDDGSGHAICLAYPGANFDAPRNFEVRGWVKEDSNQPCIDYTSTDPNRPSEEEFSFNVQLDLDWTPDPPAAGESVTTPLNSLQALVDYLPGQTVAAFGSPPGYPEGYGSGPGAAVIHVEVDLWGPSRGGGQGYESFVSPGWLPCGTETYPPGSSNIRQVYIPSTVLPWREGRFLYDGDYVSVIGTRWLDGAHDLCGGGGPRWAEIHPPDKVVKLNRPHKPSALRNSLIAYARPTRFSTPDCCSVASCYTLDFVDATLTLPQPWPNARILGIDYLGLNATLDAGPLSINTARFRAHAAFNPTPFVAFYKVKWSPPPDEIMTVVNTILN